MKKKTVLVEKDRKVLDLLQDFGFSYSDSNKILRNKDLKINGRPAKLLDAACAGDEAVVYFKKKWSQRGLKLFLRAKTYSLSTKRAT